MVATCQGGKGPSARNPAADTSHDAAADLAEASPTDLPIQFAPPDASPRQEPEAAGGLAMDANDEIGMDVSPPSDARYDRQEAPPPARPGVTVTTNATISLPAPSRGSCVRLDDGEGASASLHVALGRWFVFLVEGTGATAFLRVRSAAAPDLEFGAAVNLLAGARSVDLLADGGRLRVLASRQFYAVLLESADNGATFTQVANLATSPVDALCTGYTPALFARGTTPGAFVAAGRDYNTHIFGCASQVEVAVLNATGIGTPVVIGKGLPVLAYQGQNILTVASTFGVYTSQDGGATFTQTPNGDTTADQIRGKSGTSSGLHVALAQNYSYGVTNPNTIAVLFSDDGGASWPRRVVLQRTATYPGDPFIASDGDRIAVAWQNGASLRLMTSPDMGQSWSAVASLAMPAGSASKLWGVALHGVDVAMVLSGAGVNLCLAR